MAKRSIGDILDVDVIGDKSLDAAMEQISKPATRRKILRPAISEAAAAVAKYAKGKAPVETKELKKSIGHKTKTIRGNIIAVVGPRRGRKKAVVRLSRYKPIYMNDPVRYAHLVEFGTPKTAPQPFMRPARDNTPTTQIVRRRSIKELGRQAQIAAAKGKRLR